MAEVLERGPVRERGFAPQRVEHEIRPDGAMLLWDPEPLGPAARCVGEWLVHWAARAPDRTFLAERRGPDWVTVTYREALQRVEAIGAALLGRGLGPDSPVAILSGNGIEHGLLALAAQHVGVPAVPVSVPYSLVGGDFARLRHVLSLTRPGLCYVSHAGTFAAALQVPELERAEIVAGNAEGAPRPVTSFAALERGDRADVAAAFASVGPDTVAKILFTSGSTGVPKGVLTTQRMLTVNQAQMRQVWPFLGERPPVIVDWLPWSHTFGGSHNFNMMLANGGSLYIDHGKPTPDGIGVSIRNLSEISQTISFNVPRAYGMLVPHLERDAALRRRFFAELDMIFYAAAALPQPIWEALERLARQERSALPNGELERNDLPLMASSWGMTETAPACTTVHAAIEHTGVIGVPLPGTAAKLVPNGEKLELRVRGPNVTPGYLADPAATAALFDEEGFLLTGDAVRLADPARLEAGLVFDGRLAEDFKLSTGSWVSVSHMRVAAIAGLAPVAQDAVVAGHDRDEIGLLVFPDLAATARLVGLDATPAELLRHEAVRTHVRERLRALAETGAGSSTRICRVLLLVEPPSLDANEITDKGYLNQRAVLTRRAHLVERLYDDRDPDVIRL